jgi:predicted deacylase
VRSRTPIHVRGEGDTDAGVVAPTAGYLVLHRVVGDLVARGDIVATIVDVGGVVSAEILAEHTGYVMLLRRDARVSQGDTVCILASPGDDT